MSNTTLDQLASYQIRPRFRIESSYSVESLTEKIQLALKNAQAPCQGQIKHQHGVLSLPEEEQHYWSPQLNLSLEATETGTLIRGFYGPRPAVWTMFVFFYALVAFLALIVIIVGVSNLMLDKTSYILWLLPILIIVFFSLYLVSFFGQKMGRDQIVILHKFLEGVLEKSN